MTQLSTAEIGRRIARYRRMNGWSAQRLADNTDGVVSRSTIANIETGRRHDIGLQQFLTICLALRIPPNALLVDLDQPTAPAGIQFPGAAPAPFEPTVSNAVLVRWLTGQLANGGTAAGRSFESFVRAISDDLAALDADEVGAARDRLNAD